MSFEGDLLVDPIRCAAGNVGQILSNDSNLPIPSQVASYLVEQ